MLRGTVTLTDIARQAQVSVPTVSRILHPNGKKIPARTETIERVRRIAAELDYSPNAAARLLVTRRSNSIGVVIDTLYNRSDESFYWSKVLTGLISGCQQAGLQCTVEFENYIALDEFEFPQRMREHHVDGVILMHPHGHADKQVLEKFVEAGVPFLVVSTSTSDERIWSVNCEPGPGFRSALQHLAELGHRRVGYYVSPRWELAEYREMLGLDENVREDSGIDLVPLEMDYTKTSHREEGRRLAERLLGGDLDVTAVIVGDAMSVECISRLAEGGVCVPGDISVIGLDNTYLCECSVPKLTSIDSPLERMGREAIGLLQENIRARRAGIKLKAQHMNLPRGFVARKSTGPAPK